MLSDQDIHMAMVKGDIAIDPWYGEIQPASLELHLDAEFEVLKPKGWIDPRKPFGHKFIHVHVRQHEPAQLGPGQFVLASTYEKVTLSASIAAKFEGKSSLGRLGLLTHVTAGFIDPGFSGHITLELVNLSPIPLMLWPGMKIGQLCFSRLSSPAELPYGSKGLGSHYQGQRGPTLSRIHENFSTVNVYGDRAT